MKLHFRRSGRIASPILLVGLLLSGAINFLDVRRAEAAACVPSPICADNLWITGVNNSNVKLAGDVSDPHYYISSAAGICGAVSGQPAITVNEYATGAGSNTLGNHKWAFKTPVARWLGANSEGLDGSPPTCATPEPSDWQNQTICGGGGSAPPASCWTPLMGQLVFTAKQPFFVRTTPAVNPASITLDMTAAVDNMLAINVNGCFLTAQDFAVNPNTYASLSSGKWTSPSYSGTDVTRFSLGGCTLYTDGVTPNTLSYYLRSTYDDTGFIIPDLQFSATEFTCPAGTIGTYPVCVPISPNTPQLIGNNGDVAAGGGLCGQVQRSGNIAGNGVSYGQYVVAASQIVGNFGSSNSSAGTSETINGYAAACRPDLWSKQAIFSGTVYDYTGSSISVAQLNAFAGNNYVVRTKGSVTLTAAVGDRIAKTMTLAVAGDLTIASNVQLSGSNSYTARTQPSLGVITRDDITIAPAVNTIDAFLFSNGSIDTCSGTFVACQTRLVVDGFLMARDMQLHRLGFGAPPTGQTIPAEIINLIPQLYLNPPPVFTSSQRLTQLDTQGERPPLY